MSFFVSFGLVLICLSLLVYANAQRTIAEHAMMNAAIQRDLSDSSAMVAMECEQRAILAMEEAKRVLEAAKAERH